MRYVLPLLIFILSVSCKDAQRRQIIEEAPYISRSYEDATGKTLHLPRSPERVVSIAPNITEMLFAIGAADRLVGRSSADTYPPEALDIFELEHEPALDLEALAELAPDLLLTAGGVISPTQLASIDSLGIPVYQQRYEELADIYQGIRDLGELMDRPQAAHTLADSLAKLERHVRDSTEGQVPYGTVIIVNLDTLQVVGGKGFLHELLINSGAENRFANLPLAYPTVQPEAILEAQPEFLILLSNDTQAYQKLLARYPMLYNTPADVMKQVFVLERDSFVRPGPRILEALLQLTQTLHTKLLPQYFLGS